MEVPLGVVAEEGEGRWSIAVGGEADAWDAWCVAGWQHWCSGFVACDGNRWTGEQRVTAGGVGSGARVRCA